MEETKYFGHYDPTTGKYLGLYPTDVWDEELIPTPNIELTYEEWSTVSDRCRVIDGVHTIVPYTEKELNDIELETIRNRRNSLLKDSDWTQLPNSPLSEKEVNEWAIYRQQLRDITNYKPYTFPTPPQK